MDDGGSDLPLLPAVMLHLGAAPPGEHRRLLAQLGDAAPGLDAGELVELLSWYLGSQPLRLRAAFRRLLDDAPLPAIEVRTTDERRLRGDILASTTSFSAGSPAPGTRNFQAPSQPSFNRAKPYLQPCVVTADKFRNATTSTRSTDKSNLQLVVVICLLFV